MANSSKKHKTESKHTGSQSISTVAVDVLLTNAETNQVDALLESYARLSAIDQGRLRIFVQDTSSNENSPEQCIYVVAEHITEAIGLMKANYQSENIVLLDGQALQNKFELRDVLKNLPEQFDVVNINYSGQEGKDKSADSGIQVVNADVLLYCYEVLPAGETIDQTVNFVAKKLSLDSKQLELKKNSPIEKQAKNSFIQKIARWFWWFIKLPIQEMGKGTDTRFSFIREEPLYRLIFVAFAFVLLIGMPIAAYNSGISGDEFVQYKQGKAVLDWFVNFGEVTDQNRTAVEDPKTLLHLYGSSFDLVTAAFNKVFNIENEYEWRHVLNSLTGWVLILFCGLLAVRIKGWRAGLLAMFLVFVSPRILGHSWNNPKDIPFAMSYVIGVYYILNYLINIQKIKFKHVLLVAMAIGVSIGIRIGGLLLFAYLFLFTGLYYLIISGGIVKAFKPEQLKRLRPIFTSLGAIVILGYMAGIILWPYALLDPIANPLESLNVMTSYGTSIRQLFEGEIVWSDYLPWYYISKYILITTPLVVWLGVLSFLGLYFNYRNRLELFWKFCVFFAFAFPIAYIIYKSSNVYGGWRHALFVYPPVAVCAAIGYDQLISLLKNKMFQRLALVGVFLLAFHPLKHTFSNHPYQYQYFNEAVGGIDAAASKYETDYYYHSTKEAYEWLVENVDWSKYTKDNPLKLATNGLFSVRYFARNELSNGVALKYVRYYDRGTKDWDYYICVNSYINPGQLKRGLWPPENTAYAVKVDDTPLCAVIERKTRKDFEGIQALEKGDNAKAIQLLKQAIAEDPMSEIAYLNLAQAYLNVRNFEAGIQVTKDIMKIYPNYDKALYTRSLLYLNMGKLKEAIETSKEVIKANPKYDNSYYIMAVAYANAGDMNSAKQNLQKCIEGMPNFKPAYQLLSQIYKQEGNEAEAKRFAGYANQL